MSLPSHWRLMLLLGVVTVCVTLRPLENPDLWWQLARGKAVFAGSGSPSSDLLAADHAADADWLSGAPFYFLWIAGGISGLAFVPVVAGLLLLWLLNHCRPRESSPWRLFWIVPLLMWASRSALQPGPQLFDMLGLAVLWSMVRHENRPPSLIAIAALFLVWSNFGIAPIWGVLCLAAWLPRDRHNGIRILAALVAGAINPRGLFAWRDAAILFAPQAFANWGWDGTRSLTGVEGSFWTLQLAAWLMLLLAELVMTAGRRREGAQIVRFLIPVLAVVLSRQNIPLSALWIALDLVSRPVMEWTVPRWKIAARSFAAVAVCGLLLLECSGVTADSRRLGWGIVPALDYRSFDDRLLHSTEETLVAWAPDVRSVGLIAWLGGSVVADDIPQRALLGGRWRDYALLLDDLRWNRGPKYRLSDGGWGGWMPALHERRVAVLCFPFEMSGMHAALFETEWKPGDLDSATIPYLSADDERFIPPIVETLKQRNFVESGPWRPGLEIFSAHGWRVDLVESLGIRSDPSAANQQSAIFRELDLPLASLRVLLPLRVVYGIGTVREEFVNCQQTILHQEWVNNGEPSLGRKLIVNRLTPGWRDPAIQGPPETTLAGTNGNTWQQFLKFYLQGQLEEAIGALPKETGEGAFAAALTWMELGEPDRALAVLQAIDTAQLPVAQRIAVEQWKSFLAADPGKGTP